MWYLIIGLIWTGWLEWYTTTKLTGALSAPWTMSERLFHIILWPVSLLIFFKNLF
jgi:hypothetical protein